MAARQQAAKQQKGFASMPKEKQRSIASKGGQARKKHTGGEEHSQSARKGGKEK